MACPHFFRQKNQKIALCLNTATNQTRNLVLTFVSINLLVVWLLMLLAWYLVGLPTGPVFTHVCLKRERMLRLLEEKIATPLGPLWVICDEQFRLRAVEWEEYSERMVQLLDIHYRKESYERISATNQVV